MHIVNFSLDIVLIKNVAKQSMVLIVEGFEGFVVCKGIKFEIWFLW